MPVVRLLALVLVLLAALVPAAVSAGGAPGPARDVTVGVVLTLSGPNAVYGTGPLNAIRLATERLNAQGAVRVSLLVEDDQADPARSAAAFQRLIDRGAHVILGPSTSTAALVTGPVAQAAGVPMIALTPSGDGITAPGQWVFRTALAESVVVPQAVRAAVAEHQPRRAAVLSARDDASSRDSGAAMRRALEADGVTIVIEREFATDQTDFGTMLAEVRDAQPDILAVAGLFEPALAIVQQARQLGLNQPIVGSNGFNTPDLPRLAGPAAEGIIVGAAWNPLRVTNPGDVAFLAAYRARYGVEADLFTAQGYGGMQLLTAALAGDGPVSRESIRAGMAGIRGLETVLGVVTMDTTRNAVYPPVIQVVRNGQLVPLGR